MNQRNKSTYKNVSAFYFTQKNIMDIKRFYRERFFIIESRVLYGCAMKIYIGLHLGGIKMAEEVMATAAETTNAATTEGNTTAQQDTQEAKEAQNQISMEAIEKLVQSRVDSKTADLGKTIAQLKKENEKLKKEKLTDDEIKALEIADREKALTEKEQALLERENRLFAIKAMKEIGLDDGSQQSLELVDFVIGKNEDEILARVKAFKGLVDRFVSARVEQTFKANGRVPNGSGKASETTKDNFAVELGKKAAERAQKSNDILNLYYGGKK